MGLKHRGQNRKTPKKYLVSGAAHRPDTLV